MEVIGLLGVKGAGKDTAAKHLQEHHNYVRVAFADKLYNEVAVAFGVTVEFLGNRDTKEKDLPALALKNCKDAAFVRCVLEESGRKRLSEQFLEQPRSPRFIMQLWGTEYRRKRGLDSYWLDAVGALMDARPGTLFVVTDVRFINEAKYIRSRGGILVRVRRPVLEAAEAANRAAKGTSAHPSETEMLTYPVDTELLNIEGEPQSLAEGLEALFEANRKAA